MNFARQSAHDERLQVDFLARVVDVDSDQVARSIVVQHDAFGDFATLDARALRKIDIERIRLGVIVKLHGWGLGIFRPFRERDQRSVWQLVAIHAPCVGYPTLATA